MTHCERMDQRIAITLTDGDWMVIQWLVTGEWARIRKEADENSDRESYWKTLDTIRQELIRRTP